MYIEENKLKSFMIDSGLVSEADIVLAEKVVENNPNQTIGDVLISEGKISDDDLKNTSPKIILANAKNYMNNEDKYSISINLVNANQHLSYVFTQILESLNTYLIRNRNAVPEFNLVKDIVL